MELRTEDALGSLDPRQLVALLGSREFRQAHAAEKALFEQGATALDALVEGLSHADWRVRRGCAGLMDHLGDDRCIEPLRRALTDPIAGVRRLAIHSLGCQPCKSAPLHADIVGLLIERALRDTSLPVRRVAVHMLGLQPHDARAVEALEAILAQETDAGLRSRAEFALAEHRKKEAGGSPASCPSGTRASRRPSAIAAP